MRYPGRKSGCPGSDNWSPPANLQTRIIHYGPKRIFLKTLQKLFSAERRQLFPAARAGKNSDNPACPACPMEFSSFHSIGVKFTIVRSAANLTGACPVKFTIVRSAANLTGVNPALSGVALAKTGLPCATFYCSCSTGVKKYFGFKLYGKKFKKLL